MDEENFANTAEPFSEKRALKAKDAALWSARDALISMLRDIDSGESEIGAIFIAFANTKEKSTGFCAAGGSGAEVVGTATIALDGYLASGRSGR